MFTLTGDSLKCIYHMIISTYAIHVNANSCINYTNLHYSRAIMPYRNVCTVYRF